LSSRQEVINPPIKNKITSTFSWPKNTQIGIPMRHQNPAKYNSIVGRVRTYLL